MQVSIPLFYIAFVHAFLIFLAMPTMFFPLLIALAYDYYARKQQSKVINFPNEHLSEQEVEKRKCKKDGPRIRGRGRSKYRGVHWRKDGEHWVAQYSLAHKGEKNVYLGFFKSAEHAAMAFDFKARKRGRPECDLNFPYEHPTEEQIKQWMTNTSRYTMTAPGRIKSSEYRGVSYCKPRHAWEAQCGITRVVKGMGKQKGKVRLGTFSHEKEAALAYDRLCRKFGVHEKELNFPRNHQLLKEVRLFDNECYFCFHKSPTDPVATPCNHVFCRACIVSWLEKSCSGSCPCCKMLGLKKDALRSVTLVSWPKTLDHATTPKRKRKDEKKQPHVTDADATTADNSSSCSEMSDDDDVAQTGSPDSTQDRKIVHKTADIRINPESKQNEAHEHSSDSVRDQTSPQDSKRRRGHEDKTGSGTDQTPKKRQATSGTSKLAASLTKSPVIPTKRKRQLKYPIGTRFMKVRIFIGSIQLLVINLSV
jgi:AP2 domain/Zinc finger, C3HC4 type (RING finger)